MTFGPQRGPASLARIIAESKQVTETLNEGPAMDESSTRLHELIEDPVERQHAIDFGILQDARSGRRGEGQQRIAAEAVRWAALILRKNADYGSSVWHVPELAPECDPGTAIRVRMSDKLARIKQLLEREAEVGDEPIEETIQDFGAYCLLLLARPK